MISTTPCFRRAFLACTMLVLGFLMPMEAFSQAYVSGDEAVEILKYQVEQIQDQGQSLVETGMEQEAFNLGYRLRYAQSILERLSTGQAVASALESSLPNSMFMLGNVESGKTYDNTTDLQQIRASLMEWGRALLTE